RHDEAAIREPRERGNGTLDLAGIAHVDRAYLHSERWRRGLDRAELASPGRYGGISQERHSLYAGRDLLEQLQPFAAEAVFIQHKTGSVAARPGEGFDKASAHRVGDQHEHNRYGTSRLQQRPRAWTADSEDDVGRECNQFRRVSANALGVTRAPADVNANI